MPPPAPIPAFAHVSTPPLLSLLQLAGAAEFHRLLAAVLEAPWKNLILKVVDVKQEEEEAMREVLDQAADVLAGARLVQVGLERLQQKFRTSR